MALLVVGGHLIIFALHMPLLFVSPDKHAPDALNWIGLARIGLAVSIDMLLAPLILLAGYHFPFRRGKTVTSLSFHFLFVCALGTIHHFAFHLGVIGLALGRTESYYAGLFNWNVIVSALPWNAARYAVIVSVQQAFLYFQESQQRAILLRESELQMLKMQLHPHFFFNTLNAVSALAHRDPDEATRLIARLGDMLRITLQKDKAEEVPLKEEIEFLEAFLHIHKTLMGRRLRVQWEIDPGTLDALVPNMLLQPVVENAITHGLAPLEAGGTVSVAARREAWDLVLEVRDNGRGLSKIESVRGGIGLSNTRARLATLYDGSHELSLSGNPGGGTVVRIRLPFREEHTEDRDED